ncbi:MULTISPECIES: hypothetical protein [Aminobacterium]|jgi:hypothetical protein|uniref:hypothetical protein n=1 Tax=Aminobacterium TaxID=81466 RepID=UPI00257F0C78|nr:hypothetical protein [Aminobacterium sp. UBA4987]
MSYNAKVYMKQGGDELVVNAGGKITAAGTQASNIADLAEAADGPAIVTAVNAILAALEGVGILASE